MIAREEIHYVIAGHFAKDIVPDGYQMGGPVYYSGTQASKLGVRVTVISSAAPDLDLSPVSGYLDCHVLPAPQSTTFENVYDDAGNRIQHMYGRAGDLRPEDAPRLEVAPSLLHLGPLVAEMPPDYGKAYPQAKVCVTPQGWMRRFDENGRVHSKPLENPEAYLSGAWACVFSEEDLGKDEAQIAHLGGMGPITVCTRNSAAATLFVDGARYSVPAIEADVVDPTGAGDVFAAAFFIQLHLSGDPIEAVRFAHVAAARSIEGVGVEKLLSYEEIEASLRRRGL